MESSEAPYCLVGWVDRRPALCCEASEVRSRLITIINREATAHRRHAVLATKRICDIVFCTLYPPLLTLEPTHPHINRKVSTPFSGRRARRGRDPRPPADLHRCHAWRHHPLPAPAIPFSSWTRWTRSAPTSGAETPRPPSWKCSTLSRTTLSRTTI